MKNRCDGREVESGMVKNAHAALLFDAEELDL